MQNFYALISVKVSESLSLTYPECLIVFLKFYEKIGVSFWLDFHKNGFTFIPQIFRRFSKNFSTTF